MRPTSLYLLTWTSLLFSVAIFVMSVLDLGLWMNMSAAAASALYHIAVLVISARTRDVSPRAIFTSIPTAGCAAVLIFAWLAAFAMTILAFVVGRDEFPGPPPLIAMAFPFHVAQGVLTGVETFVMLAIARLSGYPHAPSHARSAFQRRIALRPLSSARLLPVV
ncbi:hypothetical protein C8R44DRAFT_20488 [Mycena epipterygia]|nr:hypothetical protein C8R44DRAFT_20488 [Mycena epipterygia]